MVKLLRLLFTFYRSYVIVSMVITFTCFFLYRLHGIPAFVFLFWFKVATLVLTYYYITNYKKKEFYYYQNLGVSKSTLWRATLAFDFSFFIALLIIG